MVMNMDKKFQKVFDQLRTQAEKLLSERKEIPGYALDGGSGLSESGLKIGMKS
jgi:hypothetical protein